MNRVALREVVVQDHDVVEGSEVRLNLARLLGLDAVEDHSEVGVIVDWLFVVLSQPELRQSVEVREFILFGQRTDRRAFRVRVEAAGDEYR